MVTHRLQLSMKDMKYLTPWIPVSRASQRSVCINSPGFVVRATICLGNGFRVCFAFVQAAQSKVGSSLGVSKPSTNPPFFVHCSPLTPIWPNFLCQSSQLLEVSLITLLRSLWSVSPSSKYILSTLCPMAIKFLLKSHMHLTQYVDQVCIICSSVKVTLCPPMSSIDGVCTCTTPLTHISVDLVIVL